MAGKRPPMASLPVSMAGRRENLTNGMAVRSDKLRAQKRQAAAGRSELSEDNQAGEQGGQARLFGILTLAGIGVVALVSMVSLILLIGVMGEVTTLGDQLRKANKSNKALQEDVAALRDLVRPTAATAATSAAPQPTNIDAADPANDCVIRAGDKGGVAGCMGLDLKGKIK